MPGWMYHRDCPVLLQEHVIVSLVCDCYSRAITWVMTFGTAMDVTEHEHLTQELRRREAYLIEAQRLSHTGSFGWKVSSGEQFWSDKTFRIIQCDARTKSTVNSPLRWFIQRTATWCNCKSR